MTIRITTVVTIFKDELSVDKLFVTNKQKKQLHTYKI